MLLTDVMRHLNSEHAICFLLCAYIENLRARDMLYQLPADVGALPVRGAQDIEARFAELLGATLCGLARAHCDARTAIAKEATEIFGAAVTRLHALNQDDGPAAAPAALDPFAAANRARTTGFFAC